MAVDLDAKFPRHPLAYWPSLLHPLKRLSEHLGGAPALNAYHKAFA